MYDYTDNVLSRQEQTSREEMEKLIGQNLNWMSTMAIEKCNNRFEITGEAKWKCEEITEPVVGNTVMVFGMLDSPQVGEIVGVAAYDDHKYLVSIDEEVVTKSRCEVAVLHDRKFPTHDKVWAFKEKFFDKWIMEEDGCLELSRMGFRVYTSELFGCVIGYDDQPEQISEFDNLSNLVKRALDH